jgi:cytochrome d ubiquinol oxidase subunit II
MLCGAAFAWYPTLLPSSTEPQNSPTIRNAPLVRSLFQFGLRWWSIGMLIAIGYFVLA